MLYLEAGISPAAFPHFREAGPAEIEALKVLLSFLIFQ
jgi:hypothetical protein